MIERLPRAPSERSAALAVLIYGDAVCVCGSPLVLLPIVETVYDDPVNPDDEHADHIVARTLIHGETPLLCLTWRARYGSAESVEQVAARELPNISDALGDAHGWIS